MKQVAAPMQASRASSRRTEPCAGRRSIAPAPPDYGSEHVARQSATGGPIRLNSSPRILQQKTLFDGISSSPRVLQQTALTDRIAGGPRALRQKALFDSVRNSPRVTAQRRRMEGLFGAPVQLQGIELPGQPETAPSVVAEAMASRRAGSQGSPATLPAPEVQPNDTGLPGGLKSGVEALSGMSLDNVKVHYNSSRPAQLSALAYAQGSDIHIAPGEERHLPHEAWHVVQQAQGRVQPTMQMKGGVAVNDDAGLEREADVMGGKALARDNAAAPSSAATARAQAEFGHRSIPAQVPAGLALSARAGDDVVQRRITVAGSKYGVQDGTLGDLEIMLDRDIATIEAKLRPAGISVAQVLTRFDFQDRRFAGVSDLIEAVRKELKSDLGKDEPAIDRLVSHHPLEQDPHELSSPALNFLQRLDPKGTIKNLVLEDTEAAKSVMAEYRKRSKHPESDTVLFKSILATIELHRSGSTFSGQRSAEEEKLFAYVNRAYDEKQVAAMVKDYGLTEYEHRAVIAYSYPNKSELFVGGKWNQYYMGSSRTNWGDYGDGWNALSHALKKLPNLGDLRLNLTTYRASRNSAESESLEQLPLGTQIVHGKHILNQEQQHVTSTALTYNYFNNPDRVKTAKGLMAIRGSSGVLINPFGGQGFVDGAEVLYPPNVITVLKKKVQAAYVRPAFTAPVYHLHEEPVDPHHPVLDDFKFKQVADKYSEDRARQSEKLTALLDQIQRFNAILKSGEELKIPLGQQKIEDLAKLKQELLDKIEQYQTHPQVIENYNKLVLIDKLKALPKAKQSELTILLMGESLWKQTVKRLQELVSQLGAR